MTRRALITGITGQDGSYLAEFLLEQGYEVLGMVRRSSTVNFERIAHIQDHLTIVAGDLLDEVSMFRLLREHRPSEVYNLAAQSFVQTSWDQPVLTGETTALGVTRLLDAIRMVDPEIRFYQASSSEMFGKVVEVPQRETTPFYPRSPYGVAKVYGHWITVNYRESYGLHATSGMLFNHESLPAHTPVVIRSRGYIDVVPIGELIPRDQEANESFTRLQGDGGGYEVWDGAGWTTCTARSAYWHEGDCMAVHAQGGVVESTPEHVVITPDGEQEAGRFEAGDRVVLARQPDATLLTTMAEEEARLLGVLAASGSVEADGHAVITCHDDAVLSEAARCWERVSAGTAHKCPGALPAFGPGATPVLRLEGSTPYRRLLRHELYTRSGAKRVPKRILNAAPHLQRAFLEAYSLGGGWRATSPVLAAGVVWLARTALGRAVGVHHPGGDAGAYVFEVGADADLHAGRDVEPGPNQDQVSRVERRPYRGWMCDLATESGRYAAGVGFVVVHNSPRRGLEFVTRKISHSVARIHHGLDEKLALGNLDAERDWGFAGDYVRAMWLMLQQDTPRDYVVATGTTHSVRDFCEVAFARVGRDYRDHVVIDPRFMRPAEVDQLIGDATKARDELGWVPEVSFAELVASMVDADLDLVARQMRQAE